MRKSVTVICFILLLFLVGCGQPETLPDAENSPQKEVPQEIETPPEKEEPQIELPLTEPEPKEISGLVRIADLDETILIDLKYATADNFTGRPLYPVSVGVINKETGERLVQAGEIFRRDGYRIKVWDAYRPYRYQQDLWDAFPDSRYVLNPAKDTMENPRPRHNNGLAVDITLVDENGHELEMPTGFDDFSTKAWPSSTDMSPQAKKNVTYLIEVMESVGFKTPKTEWWHFNDMLTVPGPYLDIPLEEFLD
ncbi:MAG: M15 family metallopeptidase [Bacillota bacterium]|nr:M15 family metallopeptidase [Bacillota bacterium]MDW7683851.1 M15 family metallopeptidase [Bacillota bacterium]